MNFFVNKRFLYKNFTNAIKVKEIKNPSNEIKVQYKPFFFKYQNIEYKADIPSNVDQSLKEFLEFFAKDRSLSVKKNLSSKTFEAYRSGRYMPLNLLINSMKTKTNDIPSNVLNIIDENLNIYNIRYRNMNNMRFPFESASQSLQTFLNNFIGDINIDNNNLGTEDLKEMLKGLGDIRGNKSKLLITIGSFLDKIKSASDRKMSLNIHTSFTLDMKEFNREDKTNLFLIENSLNAVHIPINIVLYKNDEEKIKKFDEEIIDNLDTLRKISLKYNTISNFGLVTDFYNWKINFYRRPDDNLVEEPLDYLTSLKYNLPVTSEYVSENTYIILMKVLTGIITMNQDKLNSVKF